MKRFTNKIVFMWAAFVAGLGTSNAFAEVCEERSFEGAAYVLCSVDPKQDDLRLFWKNAQDEPYRSFPRLAKSVGETGKSLVFALNAGMYQKDFSPLGLFIEDGEQLNPANSLSYPGKSTPVPNFYKKPNGVFFFCDGEAGIVETQAFLTRGNHVQFATQSGPMLVIENKINPIFIKGSKERTRRSGAGICAHGKIHFAISIDNVNFYDFARLFKDELKCPNALFLDGGGGAGLFSPDLGRSDFSWHGGYGPFIGLVK